ncbi:protein of unknown function (plasmid) [Cupriavidus neocaledonicus]|uniref:Uncharacterized protein n=1 Tax=Cupriavidus neocaledonicus TaxID=1040979 RepID=A0A375HNR4_9BURK|nr:hypothetical protein CBM2605_U10009 [Cupriavidus neocaledonicus]SPD59891.1 protein of unknown function [Cupriavidus neocaledonicus]
MDNKRLRHVLQLAQYVQEKRDNTRSLSVPGTERAPRKRGRPPRKKSQRSLGQNDMGFSGAPIAAGFDSTTTFWKLRRLRQLIRMGHHLTPSRNAAHPVRGVHTFRPPSAALICLK